MPKPSKKKKINFTPIHAFSSHGATILKGIFTGSVGQAWDALAAWNASLPRDWAVGPAYYYKLWAEVLEHQEFSRHPLVGTGLQDYWLESILDSANLFHRKAELAPFDQITPALAREYGDELKGILYHVIRVDWEKELIDPINRQMKLPTPSFDGIRGLPTPQPITPLLEARQKIKQKILKASSGEIVREIADYFYRNGCGLFGRYRAFRWEVPQNGAGYLAGIDSVDPVRLENLVGYDEARQALLENIEGFVAGKGANNVLIYGERGTGKSSTVKALLNNYQERGLRLVEVSPADLMEFHHILRALRDRREKFILFVDDLSFEENETAYKGLKAMLEGGVEANPRNVILIATSNRRHLIREFFSEREEGVRKDSEVHGQDTVEEKLSLSDRFGLVVSFYTPDQDTYLKIVESWAKTEGIQLPAGELRQRSLLWARQNNSPSGRTAKQFINDLKGRI